MSEREKPLHISEPLAELVERVIVAAKRSGSLPPTVMAGKELEKIEQIAKQPPSGRLTSDIDRKGS
jgi:hypothetical protein